MGCSGLVVFFFCVFWLFRFCNVCNVANSVSLSLANPWRFHTASQKHIAGAEYGLSDSTWAYGLLDKDEAP